MIRRFKVHGHSMEPGFVEGDKLIVNSFLFKLKVGDIVVFNNSGKDYLKRIKTVIGKNNFVVTGDNLSHSKTWNISRSQIRGKYLMKY